MSNIGRLWTPSPSFSAFTLYRPLLRQDRQIFEIGGGIAFSGTNQGVFHTAMRTLFRECRVSCSVVSKMPTGK